MDTIYIKKINDRWRVWMGRSDDPSPQPAKCDARFFEYADAFQYADNWVLESSADNVTLIPGEVVT